MMNCPDTILIFNFAINVLLLARWDTTRMQGKGIVKKQT